MKSELKWLSFIDKIIEENFNNHPNKDDIRQEGRKFFYGVKDYIESSDFSLTVEEVEKSIIRRMQKESRNQIKEVTLYGSMLEDFTDNQIDIESSYIIKEFWEIIEKCLTKREFDIIWSIFKENKTEESLSEVYNISRERVNQIKHDAIKKLRLSLDKDYLKILGG